MGKLSRAELGLIALLAFAVAGVAIWQFAARRPWGRPSVAVIAGQAPQKRIDLNAAPWWEIACLPGVGEAKAKAVVSHREQFGPFRTVEDLAAVSGFGGAMIGRLRDYVLAGDATGRPPDPIAADPDAR